MECRRRTEIEQGYNEAAVKLIIQNSGFLFSQIQIFRRLHIYRVAHKKFIHFLLINIFGINLNKISISG